MVFSRKPTGCARYPRFMPQDALNRGLFLSLAAVSSMLALIGTIPESMNETKSMPEHYFKNNA